MIEGSSSEFPSSILVKKAQLELTHPGVDGILAFGRVCGFFLVCSMPGSVEIQSGSNRDPVGVQSESSRDPVGIQS